MMGYYGRSSLNINSTLYRFFQVSTHRLKPAEIDDKGLLLILRAAEQGPPQCRFRTPAWIGASIREPSPEASVAVTDICKWQLDSAPPS